MNIRPPLQRTSYLYLISSMVGAAVSVGEQPIKGLVDAAAGARLSLCEALTNAAFAPITDVKDVKCSGNWMWPAKLPGEGARLGDACAALCDCMRQLGVAIDGGKDSLGMAASVRGTMVKSPGTVVVSAYAPCVDVTKTVAPDCKVPQGNGCLIYVRANGEPAKSCCSQERLAGTALAQCQNQLGDQCTDLYDANMFLQVLETIQLLLRDDAISAGHDVSDGGLIATLLEMAFAGNCSIDVQLPIADQDAIAYLFAEDLGVVIECSQTDCDRVIRSFPDGVALKIGSTHAAYGPDAKVRLSTAGGVELLAAPLNDLRCMWEATSFELERRQADAKCAGEEWDFLQRCGQLPWRVAFDYSEPVRPPIANPPAVAVVREEGSNGDREMAAAFYMAGFEVHDVCMQDLLCTSADGRLSAFRGLAFVGGFSYADVLGAAKAWTGAVKFAGGGRLGAEFDRFRRRPDTFSLGVCNGCQLMAGLGWVGAVERTDGETPSQSVLLEENEAGRFVSYFNTVRVEASAAVMLDGMHDSVLGVWTSHGEGKFRLSGGQTQLNALRQAGCLPLTFLDPVTNQPASSYPSNPNGSPEGVAAICSADGRHLAMMPHPERCFLSWQWPHYPFEGSLRAPWVRMFDNAFRWCTRSTQ